ncbi:MAG: tetratricopeptide repeat protein [Deltaproteobacteria bacterium]|nr:tetratricopeptide repeat protein [Deltaproteobacteria bacterium]MBW2137117.1 tetratricopeptide repeat protein [Deltaproteobacteria bacterium]
MNNSEDLYDEILEDGPSPATIFHLLTKLKEGGQLERVVKWCERALDIYPNDIPIRKLLAEAYFEEGLIAEAEEELERVSEQLNSLASVYKLKAEILNRQGREEEAAKTLQLYLDHHPDDEEALRLMEEVHPSEVEEPERGTALAEEPQVEEEKEEEPEIATPTLAEVYFSQGQIHEAIKVYEKVLEREPEDQFSQHRIAELKSMLEPESPSGERERVQDLHAARVLRDKERLVRILESWLSGIREMARSHPAS